VDSLSAHLRQGARGLALALCGLVAARAWAQDPALETRQARYIQVAVEMACNAQRYPDLEEGAPREAANAATLKAHKMSLAEFLAASFDLGGDPDVEARVLAAIPKCPAPEGARAIPRGVYRQDFQHNQGVQGQVLLVVRAQGRVSGAIRGQVDQRPFALEVTDDKLQGMRLELVQTLGKLRVSFQGQFRGNQLQGHILFQEEGREDRRISIYATGR
jgi:hypothetical protein